MHILFPLHLLFVVVVGGASLLRALVKRLRLFMSGAANRS